jgi:hypothetical protein
LEEHSNVMLVLADTTDPWGSLVHAELCRRGLDVLMIPRAELLNRIQSNWRVRAGSELVTGALIIDGRRVSCANLRGVFVQWILPLPLHLDGLSGQDRDYVVREATAMWIAFLNSLPCTVVNRPTPGGRPALLGGSPALARVARDCGFDLPVARYTSSQDDAALQFSAWSERAYLKPLGAAEPGFVLSRKNGIEQIHQVMERHAVSLQKIPQGQRMTVYVVGGEAAATILHADEESYLNGADLSALPTGRCADLVHALGLTFAECQVVITPDGRTTCLDVNDAPNYWRCTRTVQRRIVRRLADCLSEQRSTNFHDSAGGADGGSGLGQRLCQTGGPER